MFVKDGEEEREVGQFPDVSKEEALALYARRYLDLKAKLDLFANKLKSNGVKSREIDETIKRCPRKPNSRQWWAIWPLSRPSSRR